MTNYKIKYIVLFKAATICLALLFFTNTVILAVSGTLSPRVGNPEVYQEMRGMMNARYAAHQKPLPLQPNLILAVNLSDIGAEIEGGRVVCNGRSLSNIEELIPPIAESGVGTLYFYGGLYEMSELSKKVHDNPAHNNNSRVITSGKTTILTGNYPTQRETVGGVELKDVFGNPFSIYSMKRFNPHLSTGDSDTAREHFGRVVNKAHRAGMKVMVDFIPSLSPDAINENNYRRTEHKELDESANELFRNMPESEKEAWFKDLLARPENNAYFAVELPGRVVLGKHVVSLGTNFDQTRPDPLNEDVRRYYTESLKGLIDLGVDIVRVDLAFHLLIHGLPDEKQPLKIVIDAAKDYARSKGQKMAFILEAYNDSEREWLERLGGDHVYSIRLFEAYWNIVRNNGNAGGIKDAVWHALFAKPKPLIFPSNYDQTALTAIGGGTKGFAMLLMAIGILRNTPVMFDLRDWLLHHGHLLKMPPGGSPDPYSQSQHLFVTEEELKIRADFSKMKDAVKNAPLKKVMQDFYNSAQTGKEQYIESPGILSHQDKLFPLCWKAENGDWTMLVVNFKPSGEIIQARVDLPEEIKGAAGVEVSDMLDRGAAAHVEALAGIHVDFKPHEEYKIYTIRKPASIRASEPVDIAVGIKNTQYLLGILPPAAEDESEAYIIRYNEKSLQDYETRAGIEAGTLKKLLNAYVDLLGVRLGGKDRIKLKPSSSTNSKRQPLISVEYYHGLNKTLTGKSHVDIEGEELDKYSTLRMLEMTNMAFAIANIPIEQMGGELDRYSRLISFIQNQYKGLTGKEISSEEILQPDRIIILPPIKSIPPEKLSEYYELTIKQLKQAA